MNKVTSIALTALTSFIIAGGGAALSAVTQAGDITKGAIIVSGLTGAVQAAMTVQRYLTPPPA